MEVVRDGEDVTQGRAGARTETKEGQGDRKAGEEMKDGIGGGDREEFWSRDEFGKGGVEVKGEEIRGGEEVKRGEEEVRRDGEEVRRGGEEVRRGGEVRRG